MNERWYKFFASDWLELASGLTDTEARHMMDNTAFALLRGTKGHTPLADRMLARWNETSQAHRDSVNARWERQRRAEAHPVPLPDTAPYERIRSNTSDIQKEKEKERENKTETEEKETKRKTETEEAPHGATVGGEAFRTSVSGFEDKGQDGPARLLRDALKGAIPEKASCEAKAKAPDPVIEFLSRPKEKIYEYEAPLLPECMAAYCGERRSERTKNTFRKAHRELGDAAFRERAAAFISECEGGEDPENRGAAFTARLKTASPQKREAKAPTPTPEPTAQPSPSPESAPTPADQPEETPEPERAESSPLERFECDPLGFLATVPDDRGQLVFWLEAWEGLNPHDDAKAIAEMDRLAKSIPTPRLRAIIQDRIRATEGNGYSFLDDGKTMLSRLREAADEELDHFRRYGC